MPSTTTGQGSSDSPATATGMTIGALFAQDIHRRIEEVIKVDQTKEDVLAEEIGEYIATDSICRHFERVLDRYLETPNKPHEGVGIWVSGFFGSGKSSFAKLLGLALDNRMILGETAGKRIGTRTRSKAIQALLAGINERIPTHAVIFDVATERGIQSGNQRLTEIMYRMLLESLGYARDLDLAGLEIALEEQNRLAQFEEKFQEIHQKSWNDAKGYVAFSLSEASQVMHVLQPATFPAADSWWRAAARREDVTPNLLAQRALALMHQRRPGENLVFVIDEVGQFVARDPQKMLDLQAVVESLGRAGRGKIWVVVTSQEKLDAVIDDFTGTRAEFPRMRDRFSIEVHLEPSDISEVAGKRILAKNAAAEPLLRRLYEKNRGALEAHTRISADIQLPALAPQSFMDMYPLLPYQVRLMIDVVSGLRSQGGTIRHVGGANRTIIKLAQQLLIHPEVDLAKASVGALVHIDQIYSLVSNNIDSEIRQKIAYIQNDVPLEMAQPVAKAICLLQFVKTVHRTAENIAAVLFPSVDADSQIASVRAALDALEKALKVRRGEDGYRIPTPAEDNWERERSGFQPSPQEANEIYAGMLTRFWKPQPVFQHLTKSFRAGLSLHDRELVPGDVQLDLFFAETEPEYQQRAADLRGRSQNEKKALFWVVRISPNMTTQMIEIHRSNAILGRRELGAKGAEATLVAEEKKRRTIKEDELRRLLQEALLSGAVYFQGNDRSPSDQDKDIANYVVGALRVAVPQVYHRFQEAAAKVQDPDLVSVLTAQNLNGLPPVFMKLKLLEDQGGKPRFRTESAPLLEVMSIIQNRSSYGEQANGKYLTDALEKDPFGWEFEVVRLLIACLLRAGKIEVISKGETIESNQSVQARTTFTNNNFFRQAAFRPKADDVKSEDLVRASVAFQDLFGQEMPELEAGAACTAIRERLAGYEETLREVHNLLIQNSLPGADVIEQAVNQIKAIRSGKQSQAILTFLGCHAQLKEAIARAGALRSALTEPNLFVLRKARQLLMVQWIFLQAEPDLPEALHKDASKLSEWLARERFYDEIPVIDQAVSRLETEYRQRYQAALEKRAAVYEEALRQLKGTPGWESLEEAQRQRIAAPLSQRTNMNPVPEPSIRELRADADAADGRLRQAVDEIMRMLDGNRLVRVPILQYFAGGIETEDQLDASLKALREECERLLGEGKKILLG